MPDNIFTSGHLLTNDFADWSCHMTILDAPFSDCPTPMPWKCPADADFRIDFVCRTCGLSDANLCSACLEEFMAALDPDKDISRPFQFCTEPVQRQEIVAVMEIKQVEQAWWYGLS